VLRQLELWTPEQPLPPVASILKDVDAEQRAALITVLARMSAEAAIPQRTHENQEQNNER
jgi:hypothetical protein